MPRDPSATCRVVRTGLVPYDEARVTQKRLEAARIKGDVPDLLLLLEHPPVYTRGRRSTPEELPMGEAAYRARGIAVCDTDRGGRVTYHGPGQLVAYPILSLPDLAPGAGDPGRVDVAGYLRGIERLIIRALGDWGIPAGLIDGLTGVWTPERRKVASIGVHINRGVTTHGFAINVNNDLEPFEWIVPCGIESCDVTSVARELGGEQDLSAFATTITERFGELFGRSAVELDPDELGGHVDGVDALVGPAAALRSGLVKPPVETAAGPAPAEPAAPPRATRSRANPGGMKVAGGDPSGSASPRGSRSRRQAVQPTGGSSRRSARTTFTPCARRQTARTSASAGSEAPRPS